MSTDDRDIESSNPSKNFKVGEFDQRSGFFTPVWESKRRIRSEPPAPPSSAAGSSRNGRSSSRPPQAEVAGADGEAGSKGSKSAGSGGGRSRRSNSARSATPAPPSASDGSPATLGPGAPAPAAAMLPPAVAAVFNPGLELEPLAGASSAAAEPSALEPSGPATSTGAAPDAAAASPARPSAAAQALRDAGPDLPPSAFLDPEPELRAHARDVSARGAPARQGQSPEQRTDRSPLHQRSLRATSAAARVHEQLKAKLQAEAAELDQSRFDLAPDSQLPPMPAQDENDPYPQSLLRRLRRTIRLSTPVPDRIRSLISKYDRG